MKKKEILILTEEYKVIVYIGTVEEMIKPVVKYTGEDIKWVTDVLSRARANAFNNLPTLKHPLITVNGNLDWEIAVASLAHEASHAMDYIADYTAIDDQNGEFKAQGIGCIMRHCLKLIKK